jgi:hypothetical protein
MRLLVSFIVVVCVSRLAPPVQPPDPKPAETTEANRIQTVADDIEAAQRYLSVKYDDFQQYADGSVSVFDLAYVHGEEGVFEPVIVPEIQAFMPNTRFYQTELQHPQCWGSMPLSAVVSVHDTGKGRDVRCTTPFSEVELIEPKFLAQFEFVKFTPVKQIRKYTEAVAKLLVAVQKVYWPDNVYGIDLVKEEEYACEVAIWSERKIADGTVQKYIVTYVTLYELEDEDRGTYADIFLNDESSLTCHE